MHRTARMVVLAVFAALGVSFVATTVALFLEFRDHGWLAFLTMDSHLFVFYPTFGIVALIAFYLPACAFVDLYWRHVPYGPARFLFGFGVVAACSYLIAGGLLATENRAVWEVSPAVLAADRGEPAGCVDGQGPCARLPVLDAILNLRAVSTNRIGLSKLVGDCDRDPLIEPSANERLKRFCIASTPYSRAPALSDEATCCRAQKAFLEAVRESYASPGGHSVTGQIHAVLLPLKVFFLMILLAISLLLAGWSHTVNRRYGPWLLRIEIGIVVGVAAVLVFPLMSQAFLQSNAALTGSQGRGAFTAIVPALSLAFGVWTLFIVLFFWRRRRSAVEVMFKVGGAAAGVVAIIKYDELVSFLIYAVGSGTSPTLLAGLVATSFVLGTVLVSTALSRPLPSDDPGELPDEVADGDAGRTGGWG